MIIKGNSEEEANKEKAKKLIDRFNRMKSNRQNWDSLWEDVARFVIPNKDDVFSYNNRATGDQKHHRIYENSAVHFNEMLANTLHSMLTNPSQVWLEFNARDQEINKSPKVRKWLQDLADLMIQLLNNTNFNAAIHECYLDLGSFGTAVLGVFEDDKDVFRFRSEPIYKFYVEESSRCVVDVIASKVKMKVRDAFKKFGKDAFGSEAEMLKKGLDKKIEILHIILPREERKLIGIDSKSFEYASCYIYVEKQMIIKESGYREFPFLVPRWIKLSDEIYGRSPSMKALPDIKMLNQIMKTTIRGAQKLVDPPLLVPDDGVLGRVNTVPGGLNTYRAGTSDRIEPLITGGNAGIGVEIMNDVRERVKQHYFVDQFQLREGPQMTATEVNARVEMQLRLLGPILGRLHYEWLIPLVGRMLKIMIRKKILPANVPQELTERDLEIEVFFTSQIAKAQRSAEADNLINYLASLQPLAQVDPSVVDVVNRDQAVRTLGHLRGVPQEILHNEEELAEIREQKAQQEQAQMQAQMDMEQAEILNKAADPALKLAQAGGEQ